MFLSLPLEEYPLLGLMKEEQGSYPIPYKGGRFGGANYMLYNYQIPASQGLAPRLFVLGPNSVTQQMDKGVLFQFGG